MRKFFIGLLAVIIFQSNYSDAQNFGSYQDLQNIGKAVLSQRIQKPNTLSNGNFASGNPSLSKLFNNNSKYLADTVITNNYAGKTRYTFLYDENGKLINQISEKFKNNKYEFVFKHSFTYYSSNKIKTIQTEKFDNGKWGNYHRNIYTYDNKENETSCLYQSSYSGEWENSLRITRNFSPDGFSKLEIGERWEEGKWINWWKDHRLVNEFNQQTYYSYEEWKNNNWTITFRGSNEFERVGDSLFVLSKKWDNSKWINDTFSKSVYNNKGEEISYVRKDWLDNNWVITLKTYFTSSNNGEKKSFLIEYWSQNKCDSLRRYTSLYNKENQLIFSLQETSINSVWENRYRMLYDYDSNGNVVKFQSAIWNEAWRPYDSLFELIDGIIESIDGYDISVHYKVFEPIVGIYSENLASSFELGQNYPNPFNPETTISYQLPIGGHVTLKVYDTIGKEVVELLNREMPAGFHQIKFDASELASGIYFYQLRIGSFVSTKKLILIK